MKTGVYIIIAAVFASAVSSCRKDSGIPPAVMDQSEISGLVFRAELENTDQTKTTISKEASLYKVSWEASDSISVNGIVYSAIPDASNPSSATFVKKRSWDPDPTAPYTAYYPASIFDGTTATLPATQKYQSEGSIAAVMPMYAGPESSGTLRFRNLCGLLKFSLKGADTLRSIYLYDTDKPLSGTFSLYHGYASVHYSGSTGGVTLDCGPDGVPLTPEGKTFYVAVPAGTYTSLNIAYCFADDTETVGMKAAGTASVERNKVYSFEHTLEPVFKDYFCITARTAGTKVTMVAVNRLFRPAGLSYSVNGGPWHDFDIVEGGAASQNIPVITLPSAGDKVYFRAKGTNGAIGGDNSYDAEGNRFSITGEADVSGNIMYLLNGDNPAMTLPFTCYVFGYLFYQCKAIVNAQDLRLPADAYMYCYSHMFYGCTSLISAPELPAMGLSDFCYEGMFANCTSLTSAPELPARSLGPWCYQMMFSGCTSLASAPELPATRINAYCYREMFFGCTSLVTAPELPATVLYNGLCCYLYMFRGCTSLVSAPRLPATTLSAYCYFGMFENCSSLASAPELPATALRSYCYESMFSGCTSLTSAPELPAMTVSGGRCYRAMFSGCTSLTSAPDLPATSLSGSCYESMFSGCTSLTSAPELLSTTLDSYCYYGMFSGCSSLTSVPELPAMTLASGCYGRMFEYCSKLPSVTLSATDVSASDCLLNWLDNAGTDTSVTSRTVLVPAGIPDETVSAIQAECPTGSYPWTVIVME